MYWNTRKKKEQNRLVTTKYDSANFDTLYWNLLALNRNWHGIYGVLNSEKSEKVIVDYS